VLEVEVGDPEAAELLLVALHRSADVPGVQRPALDVDEERQVAAETVRVHVVVEEEPVAAQQVLDAVLARDEQGVQSGVLHQPVEAARVERGLAVLGGVFDGVALGIREAHAVPFLCSINSGTPG
jgi:hypothetical protein